MIFVLLAALIIGLSSARHVSRSDGRIVGGKDANIIDYPYQVFFEANGRPNGGGTLVASNIVVTAAHCTIRWVNKTDLLSFRAGSSLAGKGGQVSKVVKIWQHPDFEELTYDFDVAVVILARPFKLGPGVQTVSLQPKSQDIRTGVMANITGWGLLSAWGTSPEKLQVVQVPKIPISRCKTLYQKFTKNITNRMICFAYDDGKKDACKNDSGGPLVIDNKLAGIISWGVGCGRSDAPGVYAKISHPKIHDHIKKYIDYFG